ncbi:MAG: hypothetical protein V3S82_04610 [Dehalococcoidia bacterium]
MLARHLGKHIPGNPSVIVQNRPGAGSLTTANYIYNKAKPDGLTIGTFGRELYGAQLTGSSGVEYDWGKYGWLGSMSSETHILLIRADMGISTVADLKSRPDEVVLGCTSRVGICSTFPRMLEEILGVKFKTNVQGYAGSTEIALATERGEVDGYSSSYSSQILQRPHWFEQEPAYVNFIVQGGLERSVELPNVESLGDLIADADKDLVLIVDAGNLMGRPYVTTPGVPPDRLATLRKAFADALKDPELLAQAQKGKRPIRPTLGEKAQQVAQTLTSSSPDTVAAYKKLFE